MFPFGSVPQLVGVPGQLLPPAQPLPVLSLSQLQPPLLAQHYPLQPQPALQLVQPQQLPLAPQLVLHPQLPQAPLLFRPPLQHNVVKSQVKAKVLGATSITKSPSIVKAATTLLDVAPPRTVKDSENVPEVNTSTTVVPGSTCQQSEETHKVTVKQERDSQSRTKYSTPEEIPQQAERSEKSVTDVKPLPEDISTPLCSDTGNTKVKKMKHIMILNEDRNFCMELPLEKDDTLPLKLLQSHFPGVCGLTYRSPECPHRQWIALDGGKLRAPKGGWEHDLYFCVFSKQSGGKWLHTFCHCSFSKPSKNKQVKSPTKSGLNRNNPLKNRVGDTSRKNSQSEEPEILIVEETKKNERHGCSEIVVCSLPEWVTDRQLRNHFSEFGRVLSATVKKDLIGAHFGLIKFEDSSSQEKALAEVFHRFGDTWCSVRPQS